MGEPPGSPTPEGLYQVRASLYWAYLTRLCAMRGVFTLE